MDGVLQDGRAGKLWMCKKEDGHVLGLHVRVSNNGLKLDKLLLFRNAVLPECLDEAQVMGTVESMEDIECSLCDAERTWHIGSAALERFIQKRIRHEMEKVIDE